MYNEAKFILYKARLKLLITGFASYRARSALDSSEMSIRAVAGRLVHNGRVFLRSFRPNQNTKDVVDGAHFKILPKGAELIESSPRVVVGRASVVRNVGYQVHLHARRLFVDNVLKRVTNSLSADLRRRASKRLLFGDSAPFFALVGVSLASGTGILTKDDELEGVCWEIKDAVSKLRWGSSHNDFEREVHQISELQIGPVIAKGCSAVVYAARYNSEDVAVCEGTEVCDTSRFSFPLALKMMFNYDAESNASSILKAMYRETVPASGKKVPSEWADDTENWENSLSGRVQHLPPHPNIVDMMGVFADRVPHIPGSLTLYPDALPVRINPEGSGRNMSLFLLMKRYDTSLKQFLSEHFPPVREAILLFTQLLEGVCHMTRHGIAHRDLKSDNILLQLLQEEYGEEECPCPLLFITDFGCCLADTVHGLTLPYHTPDTDKGGNTALMAPEVCCAIPGPFSSINYQKSDAWTAGTLGYELFTGSNPFYGGENKAALKSSSYTEDQLPSFPVEVPSIVSSVIAELLIRSPKKRLSAESAATILQLYLWAPSSWIKDESAQLPSSNEILQWLLCLTTKVLCEGRGLVGGRRTLPEYRLISSFLSRVSLRGIKDAIEWIQTRLV